MSYKEELTKLGQAYKAYLDACNITDRASYEKHRLEGVEYVLRDFRTFSAVYAEYKVWFGNGRKAANYTDRVKLGHEVQATFARIARGYKQTNGRLTKPDVESNDVEPNAYELYLSHIEHNDFIPKDAVLAHFSKFASNTFAQCRKRAITAGYVIESVENGWHITTRPVKVVPKPQQYENLPADEKVKLLEEYIARKLKS